MNTYKLARISASIGLLLLTNIPFANSASSGTIHFTGVVVDGSCNVSNSGNNIDVGCDSGGKMSHTVGSINSTGTNFPQGSVSGVKWLDAKHTLGIMSVTYS
jgi:type 1 fimbria pilin